jgi:hypothetical protein
VGRVIAPSGRLRMSSWRAPIDRGPTSIRPVSPRTSASVPGRQAVRRATGSRSRRRSAYARVSRDGGSSHCVSSSATISGPSAASERSTSRVARPSARASGASLSSGVSSSATSRACRLGGESASSRSSVGARRSPSAEKDSSRSASAGRAFSADSPRSSAASMPAFQSDVLPIPGSPSSTSPVPPFGAASRSS